MYNLPCPHCGNNVRTSAAFCPNCGIALLPSRATAKPTINLRPYTTESLSSELDEEVSEIVHIDLMLKVKLYLLWDKAGR